MATKYLSTILCLFIAACGSAGELDQKPATTTPDWNGGLFGVWQPSGQPVGVFILHQGHDCFDGCRYGDSLVPAAEKFAVAGFIVYGFEMPPEPHDHGPIERYYQPVLDLIDSLDGSLPIYMAGLSGGGWTTSVVTALDSRVVKGYSIEGDPASSDWEQVNTPMGYDTLYHTAAYRLTHVYIPGSSSNCAGWSYPYPCVNDMTTNKHEMSSWAVDFILADIIG